MLETPRIYADFHKIDKDGRLILVCIGTRLDLQRYKIEFSEGMELIFYDDDADDHGNPDDLIVRGIVHYDEEQQYWTATIDWQAIKHSSEL